MTSLAELTGERIELNPDVPFPPFPVWLRLPASWSRLDSNPGTWRRSADDLIDTTFRGSRLPTKERRDIVALLEGLVADCQRAGAALSLITVGRRPAGGAASFGLHLAFAGDGRPASLGRVHDILPRTGVASEIDTDAGPAVLHRDRMTMVVPGTADIAVLTTIQAFVPIPDTTWTVVLSSASAYPDLTDALESMVRSAAESVRVEPASAQAEEPAGPAEGSERPTREPPVDRPAAPGIERGFGTLSAPQDRTFRADGADRADCADRTHRADCADRTDRVNQTRPKVILQAHATRSLTALALLLHARDRGPRDVRKPLNTLLASFVVAVVIVVAVAVAGRVGAMIQQH